MASIFALLSRKHTFHHHTSYSSPRCSRTSFLVSPVVPRPERRVGQEAMNTEKPASPVEFDPVDFMGWIYALSSDKIRAARLQQRFQERASISHALTQLPHSVHRQALREWFERQSTRAGTLFHCRPKHPRGKKPPARYLQCLHQTPPDLVQFAIHPVHQAIHRGRKSYAASTWVYTAVRPDQDVPKTSQSYQVDSIKERTWSRRRSSRKQKPASWYLAKGPLLETLQTNMDDDSRLPETRGRPCRSSTKPALLDRLLGWRAPRRNSTSDRPVSTLNDAKTHRLSRDSLSRCNSVTESRQAHRPKLKRRSRSLNNG